VLKLETTHDLNTSCDPHNLNNKTQEDARVESCVKQTVLIHAAACLCMLINLTCVVVITWSVYA